MKPSVNHNTAPNSDLKVGQCIRITEWVGDHAYTVDGLLGMIGTTGSIPDPPPPGIEFRETRTFCDLVARVEAIAYPLAILRFLDPPDKVFVRQMDVRQWNCVSVDPEYYATADKFSGGDCPCARCMQAKAKQAEMQLAQAKKRSWWRRFTRMMPTVSWRANRD